MKKLALLVTMIAVAGCAPRPAVNPNIAACPELTLKVIQYNQKFLDTVVPGETDAVALRKMDGLVRKATLVKDGEALKVGFFQTGLPACPWLMYRDTFTPVVIQGGKVLVVGKEKLDEMISHGWVLKEAEWPWQDYEFGYLPPH